MSIAQSTEDLQLVLESSNLLGLDDDDDVIFSDAFLAFMLAAGSLSGSGGTATAATTITVSSSAELLAALNGAAGGETILLQSGQYELSLSGLQLLGSVVIRSADGAGGAVFSNISISNSANLIFDDITVARPLAAGESTFTKAVVLTNSANIAFLNSEFFSSADGNHANDSFGISASGISGLLLEGNEFHDLTKGAHIHGSTDVVVRNNVIHHMRSDGLNFIAVSDVLIEGNHFSSFFPVSGDHADFIQFWTVNAGETRDVIIRANVMLQGESTSMIQGLFITGSSDGLNYNFAIEGNIYYGLHGHGISVYDLVGGSIANNTIINQLGAPHVSGINLFDTQNVQVDSNVATTFRQSGDQGTTLTNNVTAQYDNSSLATYVGKLFIDAFAGASATAADLGPRSGGLLDGSNPIGAIHSDALDGTSGDSTTEPTDTTTDPTDTTTEPTDTTGSSYQLDFDSGSADLQGAASLVDGPWGQAGQFTGGTAYVDLGQPAAFFDTDKLSLSLDFKLDSATQASLVPLLFGGNQLAIELRGDDLRFKLWDSAGTQVQVWANDLNFQDLAWHNVAFTFDAATGAFQGYYDGALVVDTLVQAVLGSASFWDLYLGGTPWGESLNGKIDNLVVQNDIVAPTGPTESTDSTDSTGSTDSTAELPPPDYQLDFDSGSADLQGEASLVDGPWGQAGQFTGGTAYVDLGQPAAFFDTDKLSLSLDFKLDSATQASLVPLLFGGNQLAIELRGDDLRFKLWDSDGTQVQAWANDLNFQDLAWHNVGFTFDAATGAFQGYYDGALVVDTQVQAVLGSASYWDVFLGGTPWGESLNGKIDNLAVHNDIVAPTTEPTTPTETTETTDPADTTNPVAILPTPDYLQDFDTGSADLQGAASLVDGPWGQAAQFAGGNAYADLGQPSGLGDTGALSVFTSFKLDAAEQGTGVPLIYNDNQFAVELHGDDLLFSVWTNNGKSGNQEKVWARNLDFQDQQWHSVGFTFDEASRSFKVYYDGAEVQSASVKANVQIPSQWDVQLGGTPWGPAFQGQVDNVAMYDEVVDPTTASDVTLALSDDGVGLDWSQA